METDRPGRRRPAGSWLFLDSESRRQRNHEPRQPEIPKRKKSDIHTRLSCKIDYLLRSNHNDQSIASEFFTGDYLVGEPARRTRKAGTLFSAGRDSDPMEGLRAVRVGSGPNRLGPSVPIRKTNSMTTQVCRRDMATASITSSNSLAIEMSTPKESPKKRP